MAGPVADRVGERVVWLDDLTCQQISLVGAKAARLSQLASLHRVPSGFCLTAGAPPDLFQPGSSLGSLSPELRASVAAAYLALAEPPGADDQPSVAVRSSAIDEDGAHASFAGQHDTFLNVSGVDNVIDAIERCRASAWSDQAVAYRRQQGLPDDDVRLAVLVQLLAPADVSAVAFSANPVSGARDEIVVTASWGLGESIVGGSVTPDSWTVRKPELEISGHALGAKERMTVATPAGVSEVDVPRLLRGRPSLADSQVVEIARLAQSLETQMGWPVDVECAFAGGDLYLLQCRPITTLVRTAERSPVHAPARAPSMP